MADPDDLDPRLIRLDPRDNVAVVRQRLEAGLPVRVAGRVTTPARDIPLGHKVACRPIQAGEKVLKYGAPIGSAVAAIAPGDHVHVHNMKSDYTATHTLDEARARHGGSAA
ncbi:hydrolase [Alsobacter metallidurans]|uniref:Hydrolase n=1 Tax=Alsobacter metallidurans TaxID=340221 RepID=A0A917I2I5_9HYPH|nr:UxaA family hydrolase [Alsobacter metallidurans]GGH07264.1 hydrolase [Alsobacter metallidurans]